jgi:hypothetical protein
LMRGSLTRRSAQTWSTLRMSVMSFWMNVALPSGFNSFNSEMMRSASSFRLGGH